MLRQLLKQMPVTGRCIGVLVFLCLPAIVAAAEIFVLPDRNPVGVGEEFSLTFSTAEQPDDDPDFSPLAKDFEMAGTSVSNNIRMINGVVSRELAWQVRLYPRATGTFDIPPIRFGKDSSPATQITVDDSAGANGLSRDSVIVELEVDTQEPYVQQQFTVTQRMLHSVELQPGGASMSHPEVGEGKALVQQLGNVINRTLNRKGIQYKVSERRYAVFPQTSGKLTFRPTVFQGIVSEPGTKRRSVPFGMMSGRQIRRFSEELTLDVKGQPAGVKGTWLPAKSLSLNIHWETPPEQFKTGEPVTLTIAAIADGLTAEQLPEIQLSLPKGIKGYSNQPELRNDDQGGSLIGTRQERWILIGTAPGEYTLPAINLEWWNLESGKVESAVVKASKITVTGEVSAATEAKVNDNTDKQELAELAAQADEGMDLGVIPDQDLMAGQGEQNVVTELEKERSHWLWLFVIGLLLLILLGILYKRRLNEKSPGDGQKSKLVRINYYSELERACSNNNAPKAYDALIGWVREDLQLSPPTLTQLRQEVDMPFRQLIDELSMVLYAKQPGEWRGAEMWKEVQGFYHNMGAAKEKSSNDLLNLHPD